MTDTGSAGGPPPPSVWGPDHGYDSGSAAFHAFSFANRNGWAPLLLPGAVFLLAYAAFAILLVWAFWPLMEILMALEPGQEPDPETFLPAFGRFGVVYGLTIIGYVVVWSVVEAALLRWLYGRGMTIGFGGAELKMILIAILWVILPFVVFLLPWCLVFIAGGADSPIAGVLAALAFLAAIPVWIMLAVRFAPAGAASIHSGRLLIFSAWRVSRGVFWPVLGAFVIAVLVYFGASIALGIVQQILFLIGGGAAFMTMASMGAQETPDPQIIIDLFTSPVMIGIFAIGGVASALLAFLFQLMFAGVNAYGVKRFAGEA